VETRRGDLAARANNVTRAGVGLSALAVVRHVVVAGADDDIE